MSTTRHLAEEMSLGYKPGRPHKMTNLPGNVGASIVRNSTSKSAAPRKRAPSSATADPTREELRDARLPTSDVVVAMSDTGSVKDEELAQQVEHMRKLRDRQMNATVTGENDHWFFATCTKPLASVDGTEATRAGDRVLLVYPMQRLGPSKVSIRMKSIDPLTAALSYTWVIVYDDEDDNYLLSDCSFLP